MPAACAARAGAAPESAAALRSRPAAARGLPARARATARSGSRDVSAPSLAAGRCSPRAAVERSKPRLCAATLPGRAGARWAGLASGHGPQSRSGACLNGFHVSSATDWALAPGRVQGQQQPVDDRLIEGSAHGASNSRLAGASPLSTADFDTRHRRGRFPRLRLEKNPQAYMPPKKTAPKIPATMRNRNRLGIWRNCSLPVSPLAYGDAIMSRPGGLGRAIRQKVAAAWHERQDPDAPGQTLAHSRATGPLHFSLQSRKQMMRFGAGGKKEEVHGEARAQNPRAARLAAPSCWSGCPAAENPRSDAGLRHASTCRSSMPTRRSSRPPANPSATSSPTTGRPTSAMASAR